jgi:hypothetical protein
MVMSVIPYRATIKIIPMTTATLRGWWLMISASRVKIRSIIMNPPVQEWEAGKVVMGRGETFPVQCVLP